MAGPTDVMTSLSPVEAKADIKISPDRLEATMTLTAPQNGGAALTLEQLIDSLEKKSVVFGIKTDALKRMAISPIYGEAVVIARGNPSVSGDDAVITYHFNKERDLKPKEKPDGTVDFRDLGLIEQVKKDALLCVKTPPTAGTPGTDVYGNAVAPKPGKDIALPAGRSTRASDDKLQLFALIDGQVEVINNKVNVLDTFVVNGNVSTATGDIHFIGNITISGGVSAGFSVQASGSIDIMGVVESARIMAGGNLIIRGGFNGGDSGELNSGANLTCKFIQGGRINVEGNMETTYILNAAVHCGGEINLCGKGLIMGGHVTARKSVSANYLGSANSMAATLIEVGNDPALVKRSYEIPKEQEACVTNLRKIEMVVKTLLQLKAAGRLTPDKLEQLEKSLRYLSQLKSTMEGLKEEYENVQQQMAEVGNGIVKVFKNAYPGVKIIIGSEQFPLQSEYTYTGFTRTRDGITIVPLR